MSTIEKAIALAARKHAGQKDKAKQPYIFHPLRLMFKVKTTDQQMVAVLHDILEDTDLTLVIGSFGASAVLVYGAVNSPLAQPRNLIGGHIISAIIGVISFKLFSGNILFCSAFAVATSIFFMQLTLTLHPPGGATALIAVIGSNQIHDLGFLYVLVPVTSGAFILLAIAIIVNNIPKHRHYPDSLKDYNKKWFSDE